MINVTPQFRQALYDGNRNYLETVKITLTDGTVLNLTNEDIWQGSMSFEDAVSSDSDFQIGAAIINKQKLQLNNMYEDFNDYTFEGAEVITNIGLACGTNGAVERIRKGTFIVDTADYDEAIVTLNLLDYMSKFDKPFSGVNISYPAQTYEIISAICTHCGVTLGTLTFPHNAFEIESGPESTTCSCREVLAWVAQICGCFARCDTQGRLELKWYDTNALDSFLVGLDGGVFDETTSSSYQTGDTADGGSFNPWNTGYVYDDGDFAQVLKNVHVISETFSHSISVDDVVITGVRILVKRKSGTGNEIETISRGSAGYVIEISNNELITLDNANTIADWLATQLIGLTFRKANASIPSDPSIEAGDVGIIFDRKGNNFPILISKTIFSPFGQQTVVSSAQTPARNSAARYSAETKNYVELRKQIKQSESNWAVAEQRLAQAIANANGLFQTDVTDPQTGAVTHYLHNKGPDGTADDQSGLNASDIRIMISDVGITMTANGTDPNPTWYGLTVDGTLIAQIIDTIKINFDRGTGGTLTLGGQNNVNGLLRMLDANGTQVGEWKNTGLTAKSLIADDYIYVDGNNNSFFRIPLYPYDGNHYFQISDGGIEIHNYASMWDINPHTPADAIITMGASYTNRTRTDVPPIKIVKVSNGNYVYIYPESIHIYDAPDQSDPTDTQPYTFKSQLLASRLQVENRTTGASAAITSEAVTAPRIVARNNTASSSYDPAGEIRIFGNSSNQGKLRMNLADIEFNQGGNINDAQSISCNSLRCSSLTVTGTKPRLVETQDYGERYLYCYETPTPMFGDIGEGVIGEDGKAYIQLDPTFLETVATTQYQIFLQPYGEGNAYVKERHESYFVVKGTVGLAFGWEIKAKQRDYENYRLEKETGESKIKSTDYGLKSEEDKVIDSTNYGDMAVEHIDEIAHEREVTA